MRAKPRKHFSHCFPDVESPEILLYLYALVSGDRGIFGIRKTGIIAFDRSEPTPSIPRVNSVRIIGGQWRRRQLSFPRQVGAKPGFRPTPDRVRETLFNWLGQDLSGYACLDLFAGSGALGFEAASRGAARTVLVESDPSAIASLHANRELLGATAEVEIVRQDALEFLRSLAPPVSENNRARHASPASSGFDLVFLDPPYHRGWIARLEPLFSRLFDSDTLLYVETEAAITGFGPWRVVRHGQAGQAHFHLLRQELSDDSRHAQ